jgi:nucleoside-diphosphate-sugar epimerase
MKHKRILVTGGCGFIGSHLVEYLVRAGAHVTALDNLSRGTKANLQSVARRVEIIQTDLRNLKGNVHRFAGQDIVFNLAALNTGVDFDMGRTEYMFEENMLLQMNPLRAAANARVPIFIQMSTASIYSRNAMERRIPTREEDDGGEPEPSKLGYAYAKRMGERLATWHAQNSSMKTVIARSINVYGERDHFDERGHFIPCMIKKFLTAKGRVEVFGNGKQKRSFVCVADLVKALVLLTKKGNSGETYNIDSNDEHSVGEIVKKIRILVNPNTKIVFNDKLPQGSSRRLLDSSKIRALGWEPKHNLLSSLPALVIDVQKHLRP